MLLGERTGEITLHKRLTTSDDPSQAVGDGVEALERERPGTRAATWTIVHGTTLVSNALMSARAQA